MGAVENRDDNAEPMHEVKSLSVKLRILAAMKLGLRESRLLRVDLGASFESSAGPTDEAAKEFGDEGGGPGGVNAGGAEGGLNHGKGLEGFNGTEGGLSGLSLVPELEEAVSRGDGGRFDVFFRNGEVFLREAAAEGVTGVHGAGAFVPTVAVGGGVDCRRLWLEGGELEEEIAVGGEGVGEVEGAGFFEEALTDGAGVEHGLAESDVFHGERFVGIRGALPTGIPEVLAELAHGFGGTGKNFGGGIFSHGGLEGGQSAFGEPVVGLEKDEPLASGEEGAAVHGIVEPAVASAVDGEVRKRVGDLERSVGRAAIHDQVLALDPLPHRATNGVFESRRGVERGGDDGERWGGGQCHEI